MIVKARAAKIMHKDSGRFLFILYGENYYFCVNFHNPLDG